MSADVSLPYAAWVEAAPAPILGIDQGGAIVFANRAAEALLGYDRGALLGLHVDRLVPEGLRGSHAELRGRYASHPTPRPMGGGRDLLALRRDGGTVPVEISLAPTAGTDGLLVQAMIVDLTERKRAEHELRLRLEQQAAIAQLGERALEGESLDRLAQRACELVAAYLDTPLAKVLTTGSDGAALVLTAAVGWPPELLGHAAPDLDDPQAGLALGSEGPVVLEDLATDPRPASGLLRDAGVVSGVCVRIGTRDGALGVLGTHTRERRTFAAHDLVFLRAIANVLADAVVRRRAEDEVRRRALLDPLTGLANRRLFTERYEHWRAGAARRGSQAALVFLDLDHFKVINDTLGHAAGDVLLNAVATRLVAAVRPSDTVGRFGGDEFVVLCEDVASSRHALELAERVRGAFAEPFVLAGRALAVAPSVGVALSGRAPADADELVRRADAAMYRAKHLGRGRTQLFDQAIQSRLLERFRMERDLRDALAAEREGGLFLTYQPIVGLPGRTLVGFEALVRWRHPSAGCVVPAEFIPVAEETGLIDQLDRRVIDAAAAQIGAWTTGPGAAPDAARVAVNVSARRLADLAVVEEVRGALERTGVDPGRLSIEITETALMHDPEQAFRTLEALSGVGVRIVLDDFGTGYSSLTHVRRFPIDAVKVDRSFVGGLDEDRGLRAIVSAVIHLGDGLGADVIAEGIEREHEALELEALGCRLGQGFFFGRPKDAAAAGLRLAATR